jgi:hypothetical protein
MKPVSLAFWVIKRSRFKEGARMVGSIRITARTRSGRLIAIIMLVTAPRE